MLRHSLALLLAALAWATALAIATSRTDECVVGDGHVLAARGSQTRLLTDQRSSAGVHRAVASFAKDIEAAVPGAHVSVLNVTSAREVVSYDDDGGGGIARTIIVGALNEDGGLAGSIATESGTNVSHIEGQWEAWSVSPARLSSGRDVLLVSGADKRGTIYALYTLSEQMGVSPWHWSVFFFYFSTAVHPVDESYHAGSPTWQQGSRRRCMYRPAGTPRPPSSTAASFSTTSSRG